MTISARLEALYAERAQTMARFRVPNPLPERVTTPGVNCPTCGADPGQPCHALTTGRRTSMHTARLQARDAT